MTLARRLLLAVTAMLALEMGYTLNLEQAAPGPLKGAFGGVMKSDKNGPTGGVYWDSNFGVKGAVGRVTKPIKLTPGANDDTTLDVIAGVATDPITGVRRGVEGGIRRIELDGAMPMPSALGAGVLAGKDGVYAHADYGIASASKGGNGYGIHFKAGTNGNDRGGAKVSVDVSKDLGKGLTGAASASIDGGAMKDLRWANAGVGVGLGGPSGRLIQAGAKGGFNAAESSGLNMKGEALLGADLGRGLQGLNTASAKAHLEGTPRTSLSGSLDTSVSKGISTEDGYGLSTEVNKTYSIVTPKRSS